MMSYAVLAKDTCVWVSTDTGLVCMQFRKGVRIALALWSEAIESFGSDHVSNELFAFHSFLGRASQMVASISFRY
jgi:hypothetical protein